MNPKKKYGLYFALGILLLINVYILFKYQSLGTDYIAEQQNNKQQEYRSKSYSISNKILSSSEISQKIISKKQLHKIINNWPVQFVVFSTNNDCTNCITDTISALRDNIPSLDKKLIFAYQNVNKKSYKYLNFLDSNNYDFKSIEINVKELFSTYDIDQFPIFVMVHSTDNNLLEVYQPEPNYNQALSAFIKRVSFHNKR
jgi:DNA polymerase III alpha subunit (gram-positive type)